MQELFIISYCHPNCTPLQSITRLSETEAYQKAKELAEKNQDTAFGRFADFHNYYPRRIRTEKWLYDQFVQLGGQPATEHPLYFVLHGNKYLDDWFSNGKITKLTDFYLTANENPDRDFPFLSKFEMDSFVNATIKVIEDKSCIMLD